MWPSARAERYARETQRDVQTVGADSLWRFRMRIYVPGRDVNNARDAAINPQRRSPPARSRRLSRSGKLSFSVLYCQSCYYVRHYVPRRRRIWRASYLSLADV